MSALRRALPGVLSNRNEDGGFVFIRGQRFSCGHDLIASGADVSAMLLTWYRTLYLAIMGQVLPGTAVGETSWQFCECPGTQFWKGLR